MAVRSKLHSSAKAKKPAARRPVEMKAAGPRKAEAKATAKPKGVKAAIKAIASKLSAPKGKTKPAAVKPAEMKPAAKAAAAKPASKVVPQVTAGKGRGNAPTKPATGKGGRSARGAGASNSAAAAVERVTERLMGRLAAEPQSDSVCREVACEGLGTSAGYCRLHYIKNWKKIKRKEVILKEGKLNQYIEELVAKYPEKYIEAIRLDLANDKEFAKVIVDLDLDENDEDFEGEAAASGDSDVGIDSLKREFEEDTDTF